MFSLYRRSGTTSAKTSLAIGKVTNGRGTASHQETGRDLSPRTVEFINRAFNMNTMVHSRVLWHSKWSVSQRYETSIDLGTILKMLHIPWPLSKHWQEKGCSSIEHKKGKAPTWYSGLWSVLNNYYKARTILFFSVFSLMIFTFYEFHNGICPKKAQCANPDVRISGIPITKIFRI